MFSSRFIGGVLLIAGTAIGAGMIGLPVNSAPLGFTYASLLLLASWFFMYVTGLYVLEVNLSFNKNISYITMAESTLGPLGGALNWAFFLGLLYSLLAAYVTEGGHLVADVLKQYSGFNFLEQLGPVLWTLAFAAVVYFGVAVADKINRLFIFFLVAAYAFLITVATPHMNLSIQSQAQPQYIFDALPVVFASLAFHIIIPSLSHYLGFDAKQLRRIIFCGSVMVLGIYLVWEFIVFDLIPSQGPLGLLAILKSGKISSGLTNSMQALIANPWVSIAVRYFEFFALASSFLGVAYGLYDLLRDGLGLQQQRFLALLATFIPPVLYAELMPGGFLYALSYAGIFVALIHGIFPVLMAIFHRRQQPDYTGYRVRGGWPLMLATTAFFVFVIYSFVGVRMGWLPQITA